MNEEPTADMLEERKEFKRLRKLEFHEIIPFVFENIRKKTPAARFFFIFNLLLFVLATAYSIHLPLGKLYTTGQLVVMFLLAVILFPLLLAPFHELIHGAVYRGVGAPAIRYGADLRQFIFYVTAHRYPVGRKKFYPVALAPFLLITLGLTALVPSLPPIWSWGVAITLLVHSTMCIGDFAMISYFQRFPGKEIYTFDDTETMVSYFYIKNGMDPGQPEKEPAS
ncbi:MAG: DUF3267 domain-containing protein [Bacteroidales bacterium]